MNRKALLAALAGAGGLAVASNASARSRTEDEGQYRRRTNAERIDFGGSETFREDMRSIAQAARITALYEPEKATPRLQALAGSPLIDHIRKGGAATMGEYRVLLDAYEDINPQAAAAMRVQLARFEPTRDHDANEGPLGTFGALAAGGAALALSRGRTASSRRAIIKMLRGAGVGAVGGGLGAAAANANDAVLSGDDAGDIGKWAAGGAALGAGLVGGRSALIRTMRAARVRGQRMAQIPLEEGPVFEARASARTQRSRAAPPLVERDSDMLAADVLHMERTLDAAGMPRVLTRADDVKDVARQIRREADFAGMQDALDTLERQYRAALKKLKVPQDRAPSLRHIDPYVTDPADRASVDGGVREATKRAKRRRNAQRRRRSAERSS